MTVYRSRGKHDPEYGIHRCAAFLWIFNGLEEAHQNERQIFP